MADTPIWVTLTTPVLAAVATWATTKLDLISFSSLRQYKGLWYAYYIDPDTLQLEEEFWEFSTFGTVTVSRKGTVTFRGRLVLKRSKAYMQVESVKTKQERLLVMLDPPTNPRTGGAMPSRCLWLGQNGKNITTAGHGLISRQQLNSPSIRQQFIFAV